MATKYKKQDVEDWLKEVDYTFVGYMPKEEALLFVNFIKEVNGGSEENETPIVHLKMMDRVFNRDKRCAILCHRGIGKTSIFGEYLVLFIAAFGYLPGFGNVNLLLYVTDSIENGVKNLRRNIEFRYSESDFLQKLIPNKRITFGTERGNYVGIEKYDESLSSGVKFTDIRLEFKNNKGHTTIVKGFGAKAMSLDTKVFMMDGSRKTISEVAVGEYIMAPDGNQTKIIDKSEIFNRPMYKILLEDGRSVKVCEEHLNSVVIKTDPNNRAYYVNHVLSTKELLKLKLQHIRHKKIKGKSSGITKENLLFIRNTEPVWYLPKKYKVDPYTLGLLLGDGSLKKDGSCILHCHKDDFNEYVLCLPDSVGEPYLDKRNQTVVSVSIKGISQEIRDLGLVGHGDYKFIPEAYMVGSIGQRTALLQGLLDTDGSIQKNGRIDFCSNSEKLVDDVSSLVRSLGGTAKKRRVNKAFRIEIWMSVNPFMIERKRERFVLNKTKSLVAVKSIIQIPDEPSQCISVDASYTDIFDEEITESSHEFLIEDYFRTHNTGVRGAKELGQRPTVAILDDLVSDADAESATVIKTIENTVYKAVSKALHPTRQKMIWLGTPFNARDPLYKAVESGAWRVSVYPICEEYPVPREDFRGSWEDRFPFSYIKDEYDEAQALGLPANFNQELMLRIMSDEDRLVQDSEILWYKRSSLLQNKSSFNFYITTDFAVSDRQAADFSTIFVWGLNHIGHWFWVDGICLKQTMDKNIFDLFRLVALWNPQQVGIEVNGQQGGFIPWIQQMMLDKNCFFNIASENNRGKPGISANTNKMVRFNIVLPWFKSFQMFFPEEMKDTPVMVETMNELALISKAGIKSKHDDCIDSISQLASLTTWRPSEAIPLVKDSHDVWEIEMEEELSRIDSYVV